MDPYVGQSVLVLTHLLAGELIVGEAAGRLQRPLGGLHHGPNRPPTRTEELTSKRGLTQVGRACS